MAGTFLEKLFNAHVEEEPETEDVIFNQSDSDGYTPEPTVDTTQDVLPAVVMLPEVVNTSMAVARRLTVRHHVLAAYGDIAQLGNYDRWRRRYVFRPWTNNIWVTASLEDAQEIANNPLNLSRPVNAFLPSNGMFVETTAPLWIVCVTAGASNYFDCAQEFYN